MMDIFFDICKIGNMYDVNKYINEHDNIIWNRGLNGACSGGHKELVLLLIEYGANIHHIFDIPLKFDDIYYLYLKGLKLNKIISSNASKSLRDKYTHLYRQCIVYQHLFYDTISQIIPINDISKIIVRY